MSYISHREAMLCFLNTSCKLCVFRCVPSSGTRSNYRLIVVDPFAKALLDA